MDKICTCGHQFQVHERNGDRLCMATGPTYGGRCACYGFKDSLVSTDRGDLCLECKHDISTHAVDHTTGFLKFCTIDDCKCRTYQDPEETPETIGEVTHKVKLGDKLEINGHIFVISEIQMRIFQTPTVKIQSLAEFMKDMTFEK